MGKRGKAPVRGVWRKAERWLDVVRAFVASGQRLISGELRANLLLIESNVLGDNWGAIDGCSELLDGIVELMRKKQKIGPLGDVVRLAVELHERLDDARRIASEKSIEKTGNDDYWPAIALALWAMPCAHCAQSGNLARLEQIAQAVRDHAPRNQKSAAARVAEAWQDHLGATNVALARHAGVAVEALSREPLKTFLAAARSKAATVQQATEAQAFAELHNSHSQDGE